MNFNLKHRLNEVAAVGKQSFESWSDDKATLLAAAIAYYTLFSLAPLIIIAVAVAGLAFGQEASTNQIFGALRSLLGDNGAEAIQGMVRSSAARPDGGIISVLVGLAVMMLGAAGVFAQLQEALNMIWKVRPKTGGGIMTMIRQRLISFAMVLVIGFLLLVSLMVSAGLSAVGTLLSDHLPGGAVLWQGVNLCISLGVATALFAMIFKILPDVRLKWREVWVGAFVTAVLFSVGKLLIGLYLGKSAAASAFGAAGSLVLVLLWVFYTSCILLLGAEFTRVFTLRYHRQDIEAKSGASLLGPVSKLRDQAA